MSDPCLYINCPVTHCNPAIIASLYNTHFIHWVSCSFFYMYIIYIQIYFLNPTVRTTRAHTQREIRVIHFILSSSCWCVSSKKIKKKEVWHAIILYFFIEYFYCRAAILSSCATNTAELWIMASVFTIVWRFLIWKRAHTIFNIIWETRIKIKWNGNGNALLVSLSNR